MKKPALYLVVINYFIIYVIWASNYVTIRLALESFPPFIMGGIRFVASGLLLYTISVFMRNPLLGFKASFPAIKQGLLLNVGGTGALIWAEQYVPSGIASVVFASIPLWIILMDTAGWDRNLRSVPVVTGVVLGMLAVAILFGLQDLKFEAHFLAGLLVLLLAAISWSAGTLYVKHSKDHIPMLTRLAIQMLTAGLVLGLTGALRREGMDLDLSLISKLSWGALLFQILFGSVLGYLSFLWLLNVRPALEVSTYNFVQPCVAIVLGILLAGEDFNLRVLIALGFTLLAVFLIRYPQKIKWLPRLQQT